MKDPACQTAMVCRRELPPREAVASNEMLRISGPLGSLVQENVKVINQLGHQLERDSGELKKRCTAPAYRYWKR